MRKLVLLVVLALSVSGCSGCAGIVPALVKIAQGGQYVSSLLDVASASSGAYFARHPSMENEEKVDQQLRRARLSVAALNALTAAGVAVSEGDLEAARTEVLKSYGSVRELLGDLGVLSATPPEGGAETEAALPEPFELPTAEQVGRLL